MSQLNEFPGFDRKGSGISIPSSFVRPVSLDRVRGISASKHDPTTSSQKQPSQTNGSLSNRSHFTQQTKESACQKLLNKKLFGVSNKNLKSAVVGTRTDQLHRDYEMREEKRVEKLKEQESQELRECSFKPKTLVESTEKRSFQEFLDHQSNHCKKTANKLQLIRDQLNKEKIKDATFRPKINRFSQRDVENKENVHTRLYELSKSKDITKEQVNESGISSRQQSKKKLEKVTQSPRGPQPKLLPRNPSVSQINPTPSHKNIPTIPRNPSSKSIDRSKNNSLTSNPPPQPVSNNTEKQLIKKIIRQLCSAAEALNIKSQMSYLQFGNLMVAMRFISEDNVDRRSVYDLWVVLKGEQSKVICAYNLCRVLCAVMGLHNEMMIQKEIELAQQSLLARPEELRDQFDEQVCSSLASNYLETIRFTEKESKQLKKFLQPLSINRLNLEHSKQLPIQEHSFKPIISEASKQLAERKRTKVLQETMELLKNNEIEYQIEQSGEISHADYLILQKKTQQLRLNRMIEQKQAIQEQKMQELFRTQNAHTISTHPNTNRHLDLYALGGNNRQKRDRPADQIQLERFRKEMTFKPDISKSGTDNFQPVAKDIDKAIYRMYEGRKMRDNQSADYLAKKKSPLLYLNINVDGRTTERLEVFEGDNPLELAARFGQKFGLNAEAKKRLSDLIVSELRELM